MLKKLLTGLNKINYAKRTVVAKASKCLYLLKQLRRADVEEKHLIEFYNAGARSVLEYACEVFHSNLPTYLSGAGSTKA